MDHEGQVQGLAQHPEVVRHARARGCARGRTRRSVWQLSGRRASVRQPASSSQGASPGPQRNLPTPDECAESVFGDGSLRRGVRAVTRLSDLAATCTFALQDAGSVRERCVSGPPGRRRHEPDGVRRRVALIWFECDDPTRDQLRRGGDRRRNPCPTDARNRNVDFHVPFVRSISFVGGRG